MGQILQRADEYETVHRLSEMLRVAREDYKTTESYALFATIVCWVMQRARTSATRGNENDRQAREVGIALQGSRISGGPWQIMNIPDMTAFDFFIAVRNAVAHGDGRQIKPLNEKGILVGQSIPIGGDTIHLRRVDMRRLGCALGELFCEIMASHEPEGDLLNVVKAMKPTEEAAA